MRAGLKLNYGCGNGSCGMCKVRVTDGQVKRTMHTDYPLSEPEKAPGLCAVLRAHRRQQRADAGDAGSRGPGRHPAQQIVTTVRALRPLAPDTLLLHLQTPRSHRLRFLAGQSLTLGLPAQRRKRARQHAIASCPCDDRNLQFFIPRDETTRWPAPVRRRREGR
jgi:CDP-4-dehydro-6-deoxyglucose reductase